MRVFYNERMVADNKGSASPSSEKPAVLVKRWLAQGRDIEVVESAAASVEDLCLAHDPKHVADILARRKYNGFGNDSGKIAKALPYTTGALYDAALDAVKRQTITCAPVSGFHHAGFGHCGGYCTFNGLMIAAIKLHQAIDQVGVNYVGILDLDGHWGDGTEDILQTLKIPSWARRRIERRVCVDNYSPASDGTPREYFELLEKKLEEWTERGTPDIVFYQAGADLHQDDPLGGILNTEQMRERDRTVFDWAARLCVPLVWCLAGGYQRDEDGGIEPVLQLHDQTMTECLEVVVLHRVGTV